MNHSYRTIVSLHDLLVLDSRKLAEAESWLEKAIPAWSAKAASARLKEVLIEYLVSIHRNKAAMENFFINESAAIPITASSDVIRSFIEEINHKLQACADPEIADACLLSSIQEINHYKISMYGTAASFANTLGLNLAAGVFYKAENDEKDIDFLLTQLAERTINEIAKAPLIR